MVRRFKIYAVHGTEIVVVWWFQNRNAGRKTNDVYTGRETNGNTGTGTGRDAEVVMVRWNHDANNATEIVVGWRIDTGEDESHSNQNAQCKTAATDLR